MVELRVEGFWQSLLPSSLQVPPAGPPKHDGGPLIAPYNGPGFFPTATIIFSPVPGFPPQPLTAPIYSIYHPCTWTLDGRGEISSTHGNCILIKTTQQTVLANMN